tara:strand:+ start:798 stop:1646 length:849 start_codon:yes stop_codon:yes gene_type:complete
MNEELSLRQIFNEIILFFVKFRKTIIIFILLGSVFAFLYDELEPKYYSVVAIASSGISEFERIPEGDGLYLNQRTAVNLINNLQTDVENNDFELLASKLNLTIDDVEHINSITAYDIFRKNHQQKDVITQKFEIQLITNNNAIIPLVQSGIEYYFNNNKYINNYYQIYKKTLEQEIIEITNEIGELKKIRNTSSKDMNSLNVFSKKKPQEARNSIIELVQLRAIHMTHIEMLKPLTYIQEFSLPKKSTKRNRVFFILQWVIISFFFSIVISIFKNVSQKFIK